MVGKIFVVCFIVACTAIPDGGGRAWGDEAQLESLPGSRAHLHKHLGRFYGPRSHYARALQTGVYDSCWRRRVIETRWGPEVLQKWICRDYFTYGSHYDWGYGSAPADRLPGYPWWW
jgi:hypothetical protein